MRRLLVAVSLVACSGGGESELCRDTPTFTNDIRPTIVEEKCIQCHSGTLMADKRNGAPDHLNFDTYESTEPYITEFADAISSGREPPMGIEPPLSTTAEERDLVTKWRMCSFPR